MGLFGSDNTTELTDSRSAATDNARAISAGGRHSSVSYKEGEGFIDLSGIGSINQKVENKGASPTVDNSTGTPRLLSPPPTAGNNTSATTGQVNVSVVTNDPAAALAAIDSSQSAAQFSIAAQNALANEALARASQAGEKQQAFTESTVAASIDAVKSLALPANERGFNNTLYVVGALVATYFFFFSPSSK